jgi:hypothetical protein
MKNNLENHLSSSNLILFNFLILEEAQRCFSLFEKTNRELPKNERPKCLTIDEYSLDEGIYEDFLIFFNINEITKFEGINFDLHLMEDHILLIKK